MKKQTSRRLSRETKQRISESLAGRRLTRKHRLNISRGLRTLYATKTA